MPSAIVYVIGEPVVALAGPALVNVIVAAVLTVVIALAQLADVHPAPGGGGLEPPAASTDAKFVIAPAVSGADVLIAKDAAPMGEDAGNPAVSVTLQSRFVVPMQITAATPGPGIAFVNVTPPGKASATVTVVPLVP